MPKDGNLGAAVTAAMEAVEDHFPPLAGQLPKDYERFEDDVLEEMMRTFDSEALRAALGDVFGRIYEYFLAEFSKKRSTRRRRVLHPAFDRPDHHQRHRARPRRRPGPSLRVGRHVCTIEPLHRGRGRGHDEAGHVLRPREE